MSLFDLEMRIWNSTYIPIEACFVNFMAVTSMTDGSLIWWVLGFISTFIIYYFIATIDLLKLGYLIVSSVVTWLIITGIGIKSYHWLMSISNETTYGITEVCIILISLVFSFTFWLVRDASFRYYTDEIF